MTLFTHYYANGYIGVICSPRPAIFLVAVWPPATDRDAKTDRIQGDGMIGPAIVVADRLAGEISGIEQWQPSVDPRFAAFPAD